ncbi:MAG TPA: YihY/virulence factor BrkB family protein [Armatimonadota bacterium]|nr:YihY/virulence factor BrkB family protein [Armatimonadota bacterium]
MPASVAPIAPASRPRGDSALGWIKQIWGDFTRQHGDLAAAAVALFGLLSLVPILLLAVWLYVRFVAPTPEQAWATLAPHLRQLLAGSAKNSSSNVLLDAVHGMIQTRNEAGIAGVVGLAWAGSRVFNILSEALNETWQIDRNRSFLKQNLRSLWMLLVIGAVFVLSVALAAMTKYSIKFLTPYIGSGTANVVGPALSIGLNVLTSVALFTIVYYWAPNRKVRWQAALVGGAFGGVIWAGFQQAFRFYLAHFSHYNRAYGTMGAYVILILWAYYSAYILILGAVASAVFSERIYDDRGPDSVTEQGSKVKRLRGEEMAQSAKS